MPDKPDETERAQLIALLEERAARVADLEARAARAIGEGKDQAGYEALMRDKAELMAALADDAGPLLDGATDREAEAVERFSHSAATSLKVGSVFFMSALLYPEDHRPGEPNDLERLILEMKEQSFH